MGRKKKITGWESFDTYEDFLAAAREQTSMKDDGEGSDSKEDSQPEKLSDFIIEEKVDAFCNGYEPCDEFDDDAVAFTDQLLREVFKAYVCPLGDPLKLYMEELKLAGFRMVVSVATAQLTLFARRKYGY